MMLICGCDEVGRGSAVAEVCAAAVILNPAVIIPGLTDSKKLSPKKRELLAERIKQDALSWCIAYSSLEEVENLNVHYASLLAMKRAIDGLSIRPDKALVDGKYTPDVAVEVAAIVKGDATVPEISAASIIAKVARDHRLLEYHLLYPEYGFHENMGYLTPQHLAALRTFGPCPIHRKTYKPVQELKGTQK